MAFTPQQPPSNIPSELSRYLFSEFTRLAQATGVSGDGTGPQGFTQIATLLGPGSWVGDGIEDVTVSGQTISVDFTDAPSSPTRQTLFVQVETGSGTDKYQLDYDFTSVSSIDIFIQLVSVDPPLDTTKFPIMIARRIQG